MGIWLIPAAVWPGGWGRGCSGRKIVDRVCFLCYSSNQFEGKGGSSHAKIMQKLFCEPFLCGGPVFAGVSNRQQAV